MSAVLMPRLLPHLQVGNALRSIPVTAQSFPTNHPWSSLPVLDGDLFQQPAEGTQQPNHQVLTPAAGMRPRQRSTLPTTRSGTICE